MSNKSCWWCFWGWIILNDLADIKMDVRDMSPFESGSFGAIIDKGELWSLDIPKLGNYRLITCIRQQYVYNTSRYVSNEYPIFFLNYFYPIHFRYGLDMAQIHLPFFKCVSHPLLYGTLFLIDLIIQYPYFDVFCSHVRLDLTLTLFRHALLGYGRWLWFSPSHVPLVWLTDSFELY